MKQHLWTLIGTALAVCSLSGFSGLARADPPEIPDNPGVPGLTYLIDNSTNVPQTGQMNSYASGDDGDLQAGVAWPEQRFTDNGDGTVTDNLTGLIWLQDANCDELGVIGNGDEWVEAVNLAYQLGAPACGLTDGSSSGDWRLPNIRELQSLVDYGNYDPALPTGHPFSEVMAAAYWSSTAGFEAEGDLLNAWAIWFYDGAVHLAKVGDITYVWPVRDELSDP